MAPKVEKRFDAEDGLKYTKAEFVAYHGQKQGAKRWAAADQPAPKAKAKARSGRVFDYSGLQKGLRLQAEADGQWFAAEVVSVQLRRSAAPVKIHWIGYTNASDEWVDGRRLRSKSLSWQGKVAPLRAPAGGLVVVTWNVAAINNNPFEYWISHSDERYIELMEKFEKIVDHPEAEHAGGSPDVPVRDVFTEDMYTELRQKMASEGWEGLDVVDRHWKDDYGGRKIISGFLKDKSIGDKRLASMPDRLTNTINVETSESPVCRPTVVNNFCESLASVKEWWPLWRDFFFVTKLQVLVKGASKEKRPCEMLAPINRDKYPAITAEEEKVSVPLQVVCMAIFDAVLVHLMNAVLPKGGWQPIKKSIVDALFSKKSANVLKVLRDACAGADILCLQECAHTFADGDTFLETYHKVVPGDADPSRAQNSIVLLKKDRFPNGAEELTTEAMAFLGEKSGVDKGDLLVLRAEDSAGKKFLVASFHGDTNGLKSKAVVSTVARVLENQEPGCQLVFGLDANTYPKHEAKWQGVDDFLEHCGSLGLQSCWRKPMTECLTTCCARTFIQPQLNKAIRKADIFSKGDISPKDHILILTPGDKDRLAAINCGQDNLEAIRCSKDNTGNRSYKENTPFPSLSFPSDHAVVTAVLAPPKTKEAPAAARTGAAEEESEFSQEVDELIETGLVSDRKVARDLLREHGGNVAYVAGLLGECAGEWEIDQ